MTRINWNGSVSFNCCLLSLTVSPTSILYYPDDLLRASKVENSVWHKIAAQLIMFPDQAEDKTTPTDYFILKTYTRITSKVWNSLFPPVCPKSGTDFQPIRKACVLSGPVGLFELVHIAADDQQLLKDGIIHQGCRCYTCDISRNTLWWTFELS